MNAFVDPGSSGRHHIKYWTLEGITPGLRSREWSGIAERVLGVENHTTETGRSIRLAFDEFAVAPTSEGIATNLRLDETDNSLAVDAQINDGYVYVSPENAGLYRYVAQSEGYYALSIGQCGGPLSLVAELGKPFTSDRNAGPEFSLSTGIHEWRGENFDPGGTNSSWTLERFDGSAWVNANNLLIPSTTKPRWVPQDGWLLEKGGYETLDGLPLVFGDTVSRCEPVCTPGCCESETPPALVCTHVTLCIDECLHAGTIWQNPETGEVVRAQRLDTFEFDAGATATTTASGWDILSASYSVGAPSNLPTLFEMPDGTLSFLIDDAGSQICFEEAA